MLIHIYEDMLWFTNNSNYSEFLLRNLNMLWKLEYDPKMIKLEILTWSIILKEN
jgi:hypothetical protein